MTKNKARTANAMIKTALKQTTGDVVDLEAVATEAATELDMFERGPRGSYRPDYRIVELVVFLAKEAGKLAI